MGQRRLILLGLVALGALAVITGCQPTKKAPPPPPASDTTEPVVTLTTPADGSSTNDATPDLSGAAGDAVGDAATVDVTIYAGADTTGTVIETIPVTRTGTSWTTTAATLLDGTYTAEATQSDDAGNTGTSTANTFTVDTATPAAPSTPDLLTASDSGTSSTDNRTNVTTPTFTGTAEANSTVTIFAGATEVGSALADGIGNYSVTTSALGEGPHTITATATDAAGNESAPSSGLAITIDTTAPAATNVTLGGNSGAASGGDTVTIPFSERLRVASICSTWGVGDGTDQVVTGNGVVTVTINDVGSSDTLTVSVTAAACGGTVHVGTVSLNADYVTGGNKTFTGNGANASTITWTASTNTLGIKLGTTAAGAGTLATGVVTSIPSYTADAAIQDSAGNAVSTTPVNGTLSRF